jgi:hypothetical protein
MNSMGMIVYLCNMFSGAVYVYKDPDVLPDVIKKMLPIKEPQGKSMTLEEYEKWRASQSIPSAAMNITSSRK